MQIKVGTRKSKLALVQAKMVIDKIKEYFPKSECITIPIVTTGDRITNKTLYDIGGKALFLKEIEEQLLDRRIDIAVHSLKDVPGILPKYLEIAAVLERGDSRDCFISYKCKTIKELQPSAIIGTSSMRRKVIIGNIRHDLNLITFRGNVDTRLKKLHNGEVDATVLAVAGLQRIGLFNPSYCFPISQQEMMPAAGQGVISIEIRSDNNLMREICAAINHGPTWVTTEAERSFVSYLNASCRTPMSAYAELEGDIIKAHYMLSNISGEQMERVTIKAPVKDAKEIGIKAAESLKSLFINYNEEVFGI